MIELTIQTKYGKVNNEELPQTFYKIDLNEFDFNELSQFYIYFKHCTREIEKQIDKRITTKNKNIFKE